jgi:S-adenosyl-L-methionine hydrolase (adenosine-forming)
MEACGLITLTTDFGVKEPYAGVIKGVIYSANPVARIVDITHEIPAHNIVNAAFTLSWSCDFFPIGTVHIAVVDPEVGGKRLNIAVKTDHYFFVGPDNGTFSLVLSREKNVEIREIKNPAYMLDKVSRTFHGRDVYAPCAGRLSASGNFSDVGPVVTQLCKLVYPKVKQDGNILSGEIVSVDTFGNLITNISRQSLQSFIGKRKFEIYFGGERFYEIKDYYSEVLKGTPLVLYGSSGYLEISMNEGNAASYFMTSTGSTVTVRRS